MAIKLTEQEEEILAWRYELRDKICANISISDSGCWLWKHPIDDWGYGRITSMPHVNNKPAHIVSYVSFNLLHIENQLDHKCTVKNCVNPNHLEDVTTKINVRRARGWTQNELGIWFCKRNHEMSGYNLYSSPKNSPYVRCRACMYMTVQERKIHGGD